LIHFTSVFIIVIVNIDKIKLNGKFRNVIMQMIFGTFVFHSNLAPVPLESAFFCSFCAPLT